MKDPYKVLNLEQGATKEEIKEAYKKMALKWHPDRHQDNPEAEEKFKEINAAYQLIKDGNYNPNANQNFNPFQNISDIFNSTFNSGGFPFGDVWSQHPGNSAPAIRHSELYISLKEAKHGVKKKIRVSSQNVCSECNGLGAEVVNEPCSHCNGSGHIRKMVGPVTISSSCNVCRGSGKKIKNVCNKCSGQGKLTEMEDLEVNIPAGIRPFSRLKVKQDLIIQIKFNNDGNIQLIDTDSGTVTSKLNVDLKTAILGGSVSVETLDGMKKIKIKSGMQPNTNISIKNGGVGGRNGLGSHIIIANIGNLPKKLTKEQKDLFQKFYDSLGDKDGRKNENG